MSRNLFTKPGGNYGSHHKILDKARHPQGEVKWALKTILILVLMNSCWHWVKPQPVLQFGGAGWSISLWEPPWKRNPTNIRQELGHAIIYGPESSRRKTFLPVLCGQVPHLSKEVALVTIPFWVRLWLWGLVGFLAAPGLVKTTGLFPAGICVCRSKPQRAKICLFSPSFSTFLYHYQTHSHFGNQAEGRWPFWGHARHFWWAWAESPVLLLVLHSSLHTPAALVSVWSTRSTCRSCPERELPKGRGCEAAGAGEAPGQSEFTTCLQQAGLFLLHLYSFGLWCLLILMVLLPSLIPDERRINPAKKHPRCLRRSFGLLL